MRWQLALPAGQTVPSRDTSIETNVVSAGYVDAMGIPLIAGRPIDDTDTAASPPPAPIAQARRRNHDKRISNHRAEQRIKPLRFSKTAESGPISQFIPRVGRDCDCPSG
jgi:hypothetical protein